MKTKIGWFITNEDGQGMIEYALLLALVVLVVIGAVNVFGNTTFELYNKAINVFP